MNIEQSVATKLLISQVESTDPITVYLEDLGSRTRDEAEGKTSVSRQGKIVIECYGESWSAYWGAMGDRTVSKFFADCGSDYLANCLVRGTSMDQTIFCGEKLETSVKKQILDCRRRRGDYQQTACMSIDREDARKLWSQADDLLRHFSTPEGLMHSSCAGEVLTAIFGDEWHYAVEERCMVPNPRYLYLIRVIEAVQAAIESLAAQPVAA